MLGNHADQFMTSPMPTAITTQSANPNMQEMPAPRPTSRTGFMPGLGNASFLPGVGQYVDAPAYAGTGMLNLKDPKTLVFAGLAGLGIYMMFFRKPKKKAMKKGSSKVWTN
ncbi:MAG: hypothetical protein F6K48_02940 [Okeania sp. SIO3H1]|nr:hypothetical protein [Okeania sp. SIO3H1]